MDEELMRFIIKQVEQAKLTYSYRMAQIDERREILLRVLGNQLPDEYSAQSFLECCSKPMYDP